MAYEVKGVSKMTDQVLPPDGGIDKFQLANELGNFLKPFGDIVALREKLLQVSSLEDAAANAKATIAAAKAEWASLKGELAKARADIETAPPSVTTASARTASMELRRLSWRRTTIGSSR
jgi:hypothetical protein